MYRRLGCNILGPLVERILAAKRANPSADTSALEREIDQRVYHLYGLTEDEIKIVEEERSQTEISLNKSDVLF
jgi:hypothetical protein